MRLKEESEKAGLKLNIKENKQTNKKTKLRSWHPVSSFHGKEMETKVETMTGFVFSISKSTAAGDCSHDVKTGLLLGRKL